MCVQGMASGSQRGVVKCFHTDPLTCEVSTVTVLLPRQAGKQNKG